MGMDERMNKILNLVLTIGLTFVLATFFGLGLTEMGLPKNLIQVLVFLYAFFMPHIILKWLNKPDNKVTKSEE